VTGGIFKKKGKGFHRSEIISLNGKETIGGVVGYGRGGGRGGTKTETFFQESKKN